MESSNRVAEAMPEFVAREWGLSALSYKVLEGGMNSVAVLLDSESGRFIAKWVAASGRDDLIAGAEVASLMCDHGLRAGRPVPNTNGALTGAMKGGELVALEEVLGSPLGLSSADLEDVGVTLARVHAITVTKGSGEFFPWFCGHLDREEQESWLSDVVQQVADEYASLPELTWATLHSDPAPEAFLRDAMGDVGLIDWAGAMRGPVLYDLASACMYAQSLTGATSVIAGYARGKVVLSEEIEAYLPTFQRLRAAVQAAYFADRIRHDNMMGIGDESENLQGLRDACELLELAGFAWSSAPCSPPTR